MKITITLNQIVMSNSNYVTCETGEYDPLEFVECRMHNDAGAPTCAFLAYMVDGVEPTNEGQQ